ncbi:hypothetical protein ACH4JS_26740 [Streptomyces sp. NPDC017638]|uniref:hypothetical protein n=1 Tax=Streptomyces sp. NPDC017638 TaxID=3365004 RepID=UPI00379BB98E
MKITHRDDWRVIVTIAPRNISDFGFDGLGDIAGPVTSGPIEVAIAPRRLGDFGWVSMGDRLASNDIDGDYQRRCEELLAALLKQPHVREGRVACAETHTCSHCQLRWEVLTAEEAADPANQQDEHTVEGEPVCCEAAITEFRAERGIRALAETGGAA